MEQKAIMKFGLTEEGQQQFIIFDLRMETSLLSKLPVFKLLLLGTLLL
jgi:hypothetical protein